MDASTLGIPGFKTQAEIAQMLQVPQRTLEDWRLTHHGPPYLKLGRHVRYDPADVYASSAALLAPDSAPSAVADAETCMAIGDVVSIRLNADVAVSEGRMSTQEQGGWYRLATTVLDRVPTRGEGLVSEAVAALQAVVPPIALAAMGRGEIGSDEWDQQWSAVFQACADAGSEIATVAFTGG